MSLLEKSKVFEEHHGKFITINEVQWSYYRLGQGNEIVLFLPGSLRRASISCEFLEELAKEYTVISLDYPPVKNIDELIDGIEIILEKEHASVVKVIGYSYGGIIAQAFAWLKPKRVEKLILSNSSPAVFGIVHKTELVMILPLIKLISERNAKRLFNGMIKRVFNSDDIKIKELREASEEITSKVLKKEDVFCHFSVALSLAKKTNGSKKHIEDIKVYVLHSADDHTDEEKEMSKYKKLFSFVKVLRLSKLGRAAMITNCIEYSKRLKVYFN